MQLESPTAEEYPFIFDSWARGFRNSPFAGCIRNCDYDDVSRRTMSEIVDRGARVVVLVNVLPTGERRIAGYSVSEPSRKWLHWIYVKRDYRGMGLGRQLRRDVAADADIGNWTYTYRTKPSDRFLSANGRRMKWDPTPARTKV
jgi:GNAT superfamily N-acetyltransferase